MPEASAVASVLDSIDKEIAAGQPAVPATPEPAAAPKATEPIATLTPAVPAASAEPAKPTQPVIGKDDWRKRPEKEIFTDLGYDPKHYDVLQHIKNGTFENYARSFNTDYNKMPDLELRRLQIDEQHGDLTPEQRTRLFNKEVQKRGLTEDNTDEDDKLDAEIQLKADIGPYRKQKIQEQETARIPEYKDNAAAQADAQKVFNDYMDTVVKPHAAYKELQEKGTMAIGSGEHAFNLDAKFDEVVKMLSDPDAETEALQDKDGNPDIRKQMLMSAIILKGPDAFVDALYTHWTNNKTIGFVSNLRSEQRPGASAAAQPNAPDEIDEIINERNKRRHAA